MDNASGFNYIVNKPKFDTAMPALNELEDLLTYHEWSQAVAIQTGESEVFIPPQVIKSFLLRQERQKKTSAYMLGAFYNMLLEELAKASHALVDEVERGEKDGNEALEMAKELQELSQVISDKLEQIVKRYGHA